MISMRIDDFHHSNETIQWIMIIFPYKNNQGFYMNNNDYNHKNMNDFNEYLNRIQMNIECYHQKYIWNYSMNKW